MPAPQFTKDQATALVNHAQNAPLQNMAHAKALSELLAQFATWIDHVLERGVADVKAVVADVKTEVADVKADLATKTPGTAADMSAPERLAAQKANAEKAAALPVQAEPAPAVTDEAQPTESPAS